MGAMIETIQDVAEEMFGRRPSPMDDLSFMDSLEYLDFILEVEKRCGRTIPSGSFPDTVEGLAEILDCL